MAISQAALDAQAARGAKAKTILDAQKATVPQTPVAPPPALPVPTPDDGKWITGGTPNPNTDAGKAMIDKQAGIVIPKPKDTMLTNVVSQSITPPANTQTDKDKAWSAVRGSYTDQYKFLTDNPDYAKALGIDMSMQPKDLEAALKQIGDRNASDMAYLKNQNNIANQLDVSGNARANAQGQSAIAGVDAAMAQGREGVMGSSKPLVAEGFDATTTQMLRENDLRLQSAQMARDEAVKNLQNAQQGTDAKVMQALQDQVNNAEANIQKARSQAIQDAALASQTAANIAQTKAATQKVQTETLVNTFSAMGEKVSNLNATDLTAMASATGLPYSTVSNLQAQAVLTNQIAKTKDVNEAAKMTLELEKLKKENAQIGKPSAVQEYEYMSKLDAAGQAKYMELKNAGYSFMKDDNGNIIAANQATGKAQMAFTSEEMGGGTIPSEPVKSYTIGNTTFKAQPTFASAIEAADAAYFAATGEHMKFEQSGRTNEEQRAIRKKFGYTSDDQPSGYNGLPKAAPPGSSFHEKGLAIDVNGSNVEKYKPYLEAQGIVNGVPGDLGHFSMGELNPGVFKQADYTETQRAVMDSIDPAKVDSNAQKLLKDAGLKSTDLFSYLSNNRKQLPIDKKDEIQGIIDGISKLEKHPGFEAAIGAGLQKFLTPWKGKGEFIGGTNAADFAAEFNKFRDNLVLPSLDKLKGAMSDKDIQFLRNAATSLDYSTSESQFKKELDSLKNKYNNIIKQGTDTSKSPSKYAPLPEDLDPKNRY